MIGSIRKLQKRIRELAGVPGGFATLDGSMKVEQAADQFRRNEPGGAAGLDALGKVPLEVVPPVATLDSEGRVEQLQDDVLRLEGGGKVAASRLGGAPVLGEDARLDAPLFPDAIPRPGEDAKLPAALMPASTGRLDGGGLIPEDQVADDVARLGEDGKIPTALMPATPVAFHPFDSFLEDGYYVLLRLKFGMNDTLWFADGHGRADFVYGSKAANIQKESTPASPHMVMASGPGVISASPLAYEVGYTAPAETWTGGFIRIVGRPSCFGALDITADNPLIFTWEVKYLGPKPTFESVQWYGLGTGTGTSPSANLWATERASPFAGGDYSCFRLSTNLANWTIAYTENLTDDGVNPVQVVDTGVPATFNTVYTLEMRIRSPSEVDYYINGAFIFKQTNFYFSNPKNDAAPFTGRKVLRAMGLLSRNNSNTTVTSHLRRFEIKMLPNDAIRELYR